MKNDFDFTIKALFILRYLTFSHDFLGHVGKRFGKKAKVNFKVMTSQTVKLKIAMYILPNISKRKCNQTMKFFQLIEYNMMANEVLRSKLSLIKLSKFSSIICDEYTDVSNKEQLSFCIRWINENLCLVEDFLGYYELPNIKSYTSYQRFVGPFRAADPKPKRSNLRWS